MRANANPNDLGDAAASAGPRVAPPRPDLAGSVLATLHAHPHDTRPRAIAHRLGEPPAPHAAVQNALERLREQGLVHTAHGHWQLTPAGFRLCAAAERR